MQAAGEFDRRERRLALTEKGTALARRLVALQTARVAEALRTAGAGADTSTRQFLFAMIGGGERTEVAALIRDPELAT